MFLGSYRFAGDPDDLLPAYGRLMSGFPAGATSLHVCIVDTHSIVVFDACPTRQVFEEFSSSPEFAAAVRDAGLPRPSVAILGTVHAVRIAERVAGGDVT